MPTAPLEFLGIGAQKAGTSWLWQMLRLESQIWMPRLKELHYFDRSPEYPSDNFLASERPLQRLFGQRPQDREFRAKFRVVLTRAFRERDLDGLRWSMRFACGVYNDAWYSSLFAGHPNRVRGEITPAYSILEKTDVERVHRLAPKAKIIFLLRNPVERAWSQIRFDWTRGAFDGIEDMARVRALIDSPHQALRSDYLRTLENWGSFYPPEQIKVAFYDDIVERPDSLLVEILDFLGVNVSTRISEDKLGRKVNVSREKSMPEEVRRYLAQKYSQDLELLSQRFGGHATAWRREAQLALA